MADQVRIDIYLNGDSQTGVAGNTPQNNEKKAQNSIAQQNGEKGKQAKALGTYVASQVLGSFVSNIKSSVSSNITLVSGKTELQSKIDAISSVASAGKSIFDSAVAGAAIGGGIGAIVGAVLGVAMQGIQYAFEKMELDKKQMIEDKQLNMLRSRAGASVNRSRRLA